VLQMSPDYVLRRCIRLPLTAASPTDRLVALSVIVAQEQSS